MSAWEEMAEDHVMDFGKYKGKTLYEIAFKDVRYLNWLNGLPNTREPLKSFVSALCKKYAQRIVEEIQMCGVGADWNAAEGRP